MRRTIWSAALAALTLLAARRAGSGRDRRAPVRAHPDAAARAQGRQRRRHGPVYHLVFTSAAGRGQRPDRHLGRALAPQDQPARQRRAADAAAGCTSSGADVVCTAARRATIAGARSTWATATTAVTVAAAFSDVRRGRGQRHAALRRQVGTGAGWARATTRRSPSSSRPARSSRSSPTAGPAPTRSGQSSQAHQRTSMPAAPPASTPRSTAWPTTASPARATSSARA